MRRLHFLVGVTLIGFQFAQPARSFAQFKSPSTPRRLAQTEASHPMPEPTRAESGPGLPKPPKPAPGWQMLPSVAPAPPAETSAAPLCETCRVPRVESNVPLEFALPGIETLPFAPRLPFSSIPVPMLLTAEALAEEHPGCQVCRVPEEEEDSDRAPAAYFRNPARIAPVDPRHDHLDALIYEGMTLQLAGNGHFCLRYIIETPNTDVTLRLQFQVQGVNEPPQSLPRTITMAPIKFPRQRQALEHESRLYWKVEQSGFSPYLMTSRPQILADSYLIRTARAEFGAVPDRPTY